MSVPGIVREPDYPAGQKEAVCSACQRQTCPWVGGAGRKITVKRTTDLSLVPLFERSTGPLLLELRKRAPSPLDLHPGITWEQPTTTVVCEWPLGFANASDS